MGLSSPCHNFHIFVGFSHVFIRGDRCQQLKATPFRSAFDINAKAYSLNVAICVPPFEQLAEKSANHLQENNLKRLQDRSFISILFLFTFQFTLNMFEVVCGARCGRLIVNPPSHSFLSPTFKCFLHHITRLVGSFPSFSPWGVTLHL